MSKQVLIDDIVRARQTFMAAIDGLSQDERLRPGAVGFWSVKDVLAHLTAWESELITALVRVEQRKRGTPHIVEIDDIDEWNEEQYHANVRRDLAVIQEDFQGVQKHLLAAVEALPESILFDNRKFDWMEGESLSYLIYENAIWHEEEHAQEIQQWREEST